MLEMHPNAFFDIALINVGKKKKMLGLLKFFLVINNVHFLLAYKTVNEFEMSMFL